MFNFYLGLPHIQTHISHSHTHTHTHTEPAILPDLQQNGLSGEEVTLAESSAPQPSSQEYVALEPPGHVSEGEGVSETTAESFHTSETHEADSSKSESVEGMEEEVE